MTQSRTSQPFLTSFGRRHGRPLSDRKQRLFEELYPKLHIDVETDDTIMPATLFDRDAETWLEIGFGGAEHMLGQAAANPDVNIIGAEPFDMGVAKALVGIEEQNLTNIRLLMDDVRGMLLKLPDACLDRVFILFPDPWPKTKHHKRRIVSHDTLDMLARVMKPNAELRMATDDMPYAEVMLQQVVQHPHFHWNVEAPGDAFTPPDDWIPTRYETKAKKKGLRPVYWVVKRIK